MGRWSTSLEPRKRLAGAAALVFVLLFQAAWFRGVKSATFDETFYLSCALETVRRGRLDQELVHKGTAPLPILLCWVPALVGEGGAERPDRWQADMEDPPLVLKARRIHATVIGTGLVLTIYGWMLARRGFWTALLAGGMAAFSPTLVAHVAVAGTDACSSLLILAALGTMTWWAAKPAVGRLMVAAVASGAAAAGKYSGLFLLPVAAAVMAAALWGRTHRPQGRGARWLGRVALAWALRMALFTAAAFCAWWAFHLFAWTAVGRIDGFDSAETPHWIKRLADTEVPAPVAGALAQYLHNLRGHRAFLMGQASMTGWPGYFAYAALFKSTPVELLLALALVVLAALQWTAACRARCNRGGHRGSTGPSKRDMDFGRLVWWIALAAYAILLFRTRVQIGHRYMLPAYMLVFLLGAEAVAWALRARSLLAALVVVLVAGQGACVFSVAPHYLAYFSPLVGGPSRGHRLLGDSNIDWGQDLPALRHRLARMGCRRALLSYFGTALPEAYGVRADPLRAVPPQQLHRYDCIAVSVNHLSGLFPLDDPRLVVLAEMEPTCRAGYSIMIYDLRAPNVRSRLMQIPQPRGPGDWAAAEARLTRPRGRDEQTQPLPELRSLGQRAN